jgi:hypothetical protein
VWIRGVEVGEEYGGSPSGGGDVLVIMDGITLLDEGNSLGHITRNISRTWSYPPFEPPPLHMCN